MTALEQRLAKVEQALSPTEAATLWLISAKEHGSFRAYRAWLSEHPGASPMATMPRQVAAWAGHGTGARREVEERTERAVRAAFSRVFLVEQISLLLQSARLTNQQEGELLLAFRPVVLDGRAGPEATRQWTDQLRRLLMETIGWQETLMAVGDCYFYGHAPLFPDDEEHLAWARTVGETLLAEVQAARKAGRLKLSRIGLRKIEAEGRASVEPNVDALRRVARAETDLFLGGRERQFRVRDLLLLKGDPE